MTDIKVTKAAEWLDFISNDKEICGDQPVVNKAIGLTQIVALSLKLVISSSPMLKINTVLGLFTKNAIEQEQKVNKKPTVFS